MKGVNAKRIAALAAGAVMLSSSAIAASVMYENVELVNPNGQPTAKIVVGSSAQISDGIAAANIASVLANYAYKSSTVTAQSQITGEVCGSSGTISGAGTCEVSNEKVTIEITLPGVLANAHEFKTLISDYVDKTLANREYGLTEDIYQGASTASTRSDSSEILTPLRSTSDLAIGQLYMIGSGQFQGFSPVSVVDNQAADAKYTAEQAFWVGGRVNGYSRESSSVYYDSNNQYRSVVARPRVVAYSLTFKGNEYGIPVCTSNLATSGDWTSCNSTSYESDQHRIKIPFLGQDWIISGMTAPSNAIKPLTNSQGVVNGGEVKLAKEAKYDIVNVGGVIDGGDFKIRLADISVATGQNNAHPAIIDVLDANDAVVGQIQVNPADTYEFVQSSTGKSIKVHVYRTAPGFTLSAKWAEIAIYTDEIILEDGKRYDRASADDANYKYLKASIYWKNRDGAAYPLNQPDALREIVLWDQESFDNSKMVAGDTVNFPKKNTAFRLSYNGLDLVDSDYTSLTISNNGNTELSLCDKSSGSFACSTKNATVTGYFIKVSTGTTNGLGGEGLMGTDRSEVFYLDPIGVYSIGANGVGGNTNVSNTNITGVSNFVASAIMVQNTTYLADATVNATLYPTIFWKTGSDDYYKYGSVTAGIVLTNPDGTVSSTNGVYFDVLGQSSLAKGQIHINVRNSTNQLGGTSTTLNYSGFYADNPAASSVLFGEFVIQEDAGKANVTSSAKVWTRVPFMNFTGTEWRFKATDSSTVYAYYGGLNLSNSGGASNTPLEASAMEPTVITERGSKISGVGTTSVEFMAAKKVGMPSFTFSYADEALATSGELWEAVEGDTKTLTNGVKLTVKTIGQTVGACKAQTSEGSTATCTVNNDAISARIMPNNVASVEVIEPYDIRMASDMVMLDSQAGGAGGFVISVGGPVVNSVTADVLADSAVDFDTTSVYVKAIGSKIVVAGKSAADTMQAAEEFIAALQKN